MVERVQEAHAELQARQHELKEEAERLYEELQRANDDLNQFAFATSHDLQEPLRRITSYSQLLVKGYQSQLDGDAGVCVENITRGAKRMQDLLSGLLAYTATGADKAEADEAIDLNTLV